MFCYSCGAELPKGAHFCPKCGQSRTVKTNSEVSKGITFEDELRPINDVLPKPTNKEPNLNTTSEKSQGHSSKISVSNAPLNNGSSEWRVLNENGSGNTSMEFFDDTLFAVAFIPDGDTLRMPLMADGKMIVSGPVGAFHIGRKSKLIFYLTEKYELMACDFQGRKTQKIAGGNGDRVLDFAVNEDQLFVLLQGKNSNISIFQVGQTLDTSNVLKKSEQLRGLAADQDFLYYIEGTALTQYDLKTGSEKVIMSRTGINTFQLYNGHLILTISDNPFSTHDRNNQILLIDPSRMLQRTVVQVAAKNVNCYWDHVFYTDSKNERIWTVPLTGGTPHMLRNKAADSLNLACGHLYFIDCAGVEFAAINLSSGKELPSNSEKIPEAAADAIKYSLLNQGPEHYKGYTLYEALLEGVSVLQEFNSKSELFDYVVFLTLPQLNKKREDIPALLKAAGYQQKPGSEPIVFVDSTISHKRGKGFIVATDGIYTDKTFFPYDYTFDCEREGGPQNIRLRTYEKVRFGKEKRTLDISCPMFKSGLEDLVELIYTIYAFSYIGSFKEGVYNGFGALFSVDEYDLSSVVYDLAQTGAITSEEVGSDLVQYLFNHVSYEGHFKDGQKNGKGNGFDIFPITLTYTNEPIDEYRYYNAYPDVTKGEYKNDELTGNAIIYEHNHLKFSGKLDKGIENGKGTWYYNNGQIQYEGEFKNGTAHGKGAYYSENGELIYSGQWKNGDYAH